MACPDTNSNISVCATFSSAGLNCVAVLHVLDGVCDVKDKLHVHGSLWYTGATSMDDGDQSAVQFVHVALREEPASTASLVLHLSVKKTNKTHT